MQILVTGGAGFLGSHVADALSDAGHSVTIFDINESRYLRKDQKMIKGDMLDENLIDSIVKKQDIVYHMAGIADIDQCKANPFDTVKQNILGTTFMLEACRKHDVKKFVFASSIYVYSDSGSFYRISKQACESLIEEYHQKYNLKYTILRYGTLYGERADERNSIYRLIKQAIEKRKIVYSGDIDDLREFIHVRDASKSSVKILEEEFDNQHIILTGIRAVRYRELLETISEILKGEIEIEIKNTENKAHYKVTPYNFSPKLGKKLVNNPHIDMGQGLLLCMAEVFEQDQKNGFLSQENDDE